MSKENLVNGKHYPLWEQFIDKKEEWVGGTLTDYGDSFDRSAGIATEDGMKTEITDIKLLPNGDESALFEITGKDFSCSFDVGHGGISGGQGEPHKGSALTFSGYGGHSFTIQQPFYE